MKATRIILIGFMGTGKTAVGERLATRLGFDFFDTDLMIEKEKGRSISEIFDQDGEEAFRELEKKLIRKVVEQDKAVIATGGGAVTIPENLELLKEKGALIALSASPEVILERVRAIHGRPLLKGDDLMETIKGLLSRRSPYYRQADHIVDTTGKEIDATVDEIIKILHEKDPR